MPPQVRTLSVLAPLALVAALLPVITSAKTNVDFNPELDFSKYKTFAYIGGVEHLTQLQVNPNLLRDTVHEAVARELIKRGLTEVRRQDNPDLVVRYRAESATEVNYAGNDDWGGFDQYTVDWWASSYTLWYSSTTREGSLLIDLIDVKRRDLAWRLYMQQKIINVDKLPAKITDEIADGFKSFPPTEKDKDEIRKEHAKHVKEKSKTPQFQ